MINIEISGRLPNFENFSFTSTFEKIAKHLEMSIKMNFAEGGRPEIWQPKKKDGQPSHLFLTGALFDSIGSDSGVDFAEAGAMTLLPYSFAHQYGYAPRNLPQREYILFQEEDIEFCLQTMGDDIVRFWKTNGEEIN